MTGTDDTRRTDASASKTRLTRRRALQAAAAAGAVATGVGTGTIGSATAGLAAFDDLSVDSENRIVDESGNPFVMRGLNVADPKRIEVSKRVRGKTATQIVDHVTDPDDGWYPRVIRVPASPADIGEHPNGHAGPSYFEGGDLNPDAPDIANPDAIADDRRAMQPPQPPAFTREQLRDYLATHYDPVVERCRERGVYCIVDFHRHWHEQPPGTEEPNNHENHLPFDSEYTNYWAYNTHEWIGGKEAPGSWNHVDAVAIEETTGCNSADEWTCIRDESDIPGTPYAEDMWEVNEDLLEEVTMFWDEVAARYADEPHVLFEPYNEPTAPGIWGPVEGCGGLLQKPLWRTYLYDFAAPIVDAIRAHAPETLLLMGVPGWSQGTQGLHWENFTEAGFENVAVTWHNYGQHDVSQVNNWLNDTTYESLSDVEAEAGTELEDPFVEPPDSVGEVQCWGWEGFQAGGLQNAMDHHPVAVTEFGWMDRSPNVWCRCPSAGPTTFTYGEPLLDAMESDDRISWVAWAADSRWQPVMFDVPWTVDASELDLVNDNWYHPDTEIPTKCEDLPCEWDLLGNPDSGEYVKERLEEHRADLVPFDTVGEPPTPTDSTPTPTDPTPTDPRPGSPTSPDDQWINEVTPTAIDVGWSPVEAANHYTVYLDGSVVARPTAASTVLSGLAPATNYQVGLSAVSADGVESPAATTQMATPAGSRPSPVGDTDRRPTDPDADGLYEDVNGDGATNLADAGDLFQHRESAAVQNDVDAYDFSGNDEIDLADVVQLFQENT